MDYYEKVDEINQNLANKKELDNYIENILDGAFEWMESGDTYLKVSKRDLDMSFSLRNKTAEILKNEIIDKIKSKINDYQKIIDRIEKLPIK